MVNNILPKKYRVKYPGILVAEFTKVNDIQDELSFISYNKIIPKNLLDKLLLTELTNKTNP